MSNSGSFCRFLLVFAPSLTVSTTLTGLLYQTLSAGAKFALADEYNTNLPTQIASHKTAMSDGAAQYGSHLEYAFVQYAS